MPRTGLEPARVASLPPQSSASANSATWALIRMSGGDYTAGIDGVEGSFRSAGTRVRTAGTRVPGIAATAGGVGTRVRTADSRVRGVGTTAGRGLGVLG